MNASRLATAVLSTGLVVGSAMPAAWATFVESASASATFSAAVLAPPTGVTVSSPYCGQNGHAVDVSWEPSRSDWLDGYEVALGTAAGGPYAVVPLPAGADPTTTARAVDGLMRKTTYYVVVRTTRGGWRAAASPVAVTTAPRNCA